MAKGFSCWVIVTGATPTAFRARHPDDLLPTLRQLQRTQPDATMKWFERGRFWNSPEEAVLAQRARNQAAAGRDRAWRPGGDHVDPRAKYQISRDEKRARFKQRAIRDRIEGRGAPPSDDKPKGPSDETRPRDNRPPDGGSHDRPKAPFRDTRPPADRRFGDNRRPDNRRFGKPRPPGKDSSWGSRPPDQRGRKPGSSDWSRPGGQDRPQGGGWRPKGNRPPGDRPPGHRPPGHRPPGAGSTHRPGPGSSGWSRPGGPSRPGNPNRPQGSWGSKERRPPGNRPPGNWGSKDRRPPGHRLPGGPFRPRRDNRGKKPK